MKHATISCSAILFCNYAFFICSKSNNYFNRQLIRAEIYAMPAIAVDRHR